MESLVETFRDFPTHLYSIYPNLEESKPEWMEMNSTLSVIIPTFQEEKYLSDTLSKLMSTNSSIPFEIVVVDGGSTDNTVKIAKCFTKKVYQIHERGIAKAKNIGAEHANGEILLFLDADVNTPPKFLEKISKILTNSGVVGVTCNIMPTQSSPFERVFFRFYNLLLQFVSRFRPHSRGEFLAVKKAAFFTIGGFNENLPCLEDHDLAYRLSKIGRFIYIKDFTVYESLRRFQKLGLFRVVGTWMIDYLSFIIRGKPFSKIWNPVR